MAETAGKLSMETLTFQLPVQSAWRGWLAGKGQWVVISRAVPVPAHSFRRTSSV